MQTFYKLLGSALIAVTTNNFIWFALTYFVYLETKSVAATGFIAGIYLVVTALSGFWLGSLVDHHKKKPVMLGSSLVSLCFFSLGFLLFSLVPREVLTTVTSPWLWIFVLLLMCGVVAGNIYGIAIPTLVSILVPQDKHAKANGLFGTVMGVSFAITSVASGLMLGFGGMNLVLITSIIFTLVSIVYLVLITVPEKKIVHLNAEGMPMSRKVDIKGTIKVIRMIPGLFALIFYTTINNFLGGTFMALMDAYGLSLVSVQVWGLMWGVLSLGFIVGGLIIAKKGLGKNPLNTLLKINVITWTVCIFFTIQPSIILLFIGMALWMILFPFVEASEQTILQKVVPVERQGRVFGFAQSVEQAASPVTAFLIGPLTQFIFIPFMTTGQGTKLIGSWFGVGPGRGIALVFVIAGILGLTITLFVLNSKSYRLLSEKYQGKN